MNNYSLWINGQATVGASTMPVLNPATEQVVAECPRADEAQLNEAVAAAKAAFPAWSKTDIEERRKILLAMADALESRADDFARLLTAEQGKPLPHAQMEVMGSAMMMRVLAGLEIKEKLLSEDDNGKVIEHRTPLGVVGAIIPWNFPISLLVVKIVPALLAGNTVVVKPAPTTPLTTLLFAEVTNDLLPAGVMNVITDANDLGAVLTNHPDVAKISFTGSTATGKKVMAGAASALKRVTLELGGNDAAIVLDDVEPKLAAQKLFDGAMINSGQVCLAIKRAYVPAAQYDAICDELKVLADGAVVGDGSEQGTQFGPIQNQMQFDRVKELIAEAANDGTIIAGGEPDEGSGYFVRPTIVRDIADDARLVREEQFGPVLPVMRYSDIDEVLARANDSEYGLGGTIWTADAERGLEIAKKVESGMIWVNSHMNIDPTIATGGAKQSGIGMELGEEGLNEFTQRHVIYVTKTLAG